MEQAYELAELELELQMQTEMTATTAAHNTPVAAANAAPANAATPVA